jgi:GR25 family glycosyltransferase involved in LPS biosynthesis
MRKYNYVISAKNALGANKFTIKAQIAKIVDLTVFNHLDSVSIAMLKELAYDDSVEVDITGDVESGGCFRSHFGMYGSDVTDYIKHNNL